MSIQILDSDVVDQIAAGEVVERPSHLVKELVENSLDAGASKIVVDFSLGGKFVQVTDNGSGIAEEDLEIALARHATSKIRTADDLWKLHSFGFRGEALASIAAVSDLTMVSRTAQAASAVRLKSEFGIKQPIENVGGATGTHILIKDLFKNVPARLKFLKSEASESSAIKTVLKALALAHPRVEFLIQENGKMTLFYPAAQTRQQRAEQIFEISPLYVGEAEREGVRAYAVFADPHHVAKTGKNIWIFAQNRWIQDRGLSAAVMEAYRSLLMHGEFPYAAVWVETDPSMIDVNIHPTKSQVKFQNQSLAFRAVQASLRDALEKAPWIRSPSSLSRGVHDTADESFNSDIKNISSSEQVDLGLTSAAQEKFNSSDFDVTLYAKKDFNSSASEASGVSGSTGGGFSVSSSRNTNSVLMESTNRYEENLENSSVQKSYWSSLDVLGQAHLTYILCSRGDALVLVDQHAAHERVAFEKLMRAWNGGKIEVQEFLFPLAIDLTPEKVEALAQYFSDFEKLGVCFEVLGPSTVGVKAAPAIIKDSVFARIVEKLATDIVDKGGSFRMEKVIIDLLATMACHSVVRAGQALSLPEMKSLLQAMDEFPLSSFCPHGRPVSIEYSYSSIEKSFGRTL